MLGSREMVYRNFVNVMKMQNVLLLIEKENKGICGLLIMETWPRNWKMDVYSWVSCIVTLDYYFIIIT